MNCVSDEAMERSRENDKRERPKRRRHVFPSGVKSWISPEGQRMATPGCERQASLRPLAPRSWIAKRYATDGPSASKI